jgi:hypothetical protein
LSEENILDNVELIDRHVAGSGVGGRGIQKWRTLFDAGPAS